MKIYLMSLDEAEKLNASACEKLFPNRVSRSKKCVRKTDRLRMLGAGALLHGVLGVNEKDILFGEHNKPYIKNSKIHFNLSHSGNYSVLAVDDTPIGVDIEQIDTRHLSVAKKVFTVEELLWVKEDLPLRFFKLWTLKESALKLLGTGLTVDARSFSVLPIISSKPITVLNTVCYGKTKEIENHILSVCSSKDFSMPEYTVCNSDII